MARKKKQKLPWYKKLFSSRRRIALVLLIPILIISLAAVKAEETTPGDIREYIFEQMRARGISPNPPLTISEGCKQGLDVALILDGSGSTGGGVSYGNILIEGFSGQNGKLQGGIRMSITHFARWARVAVPLTNDVATIKAWTKASGAGLDDGTAWGEALDTGYGSLASSPPSVPKLVILVSDGFPNTESTEVVVRRANAIKQSGVRIMGVLTDNYKDMKDYPADSEAMWLTGVPVVGFMNITNSVDSAINTGRIPDVMFGRESALVTELRKLAYRICNSGGGDGDGVGNNGRGIGNKGIGVGNSGVGNGRSPQSPNPNPTPTPSASATDTNTQNNPAPTPKGQGLSTTPPPELPSPFFDGIQYTKASEVMNFASSVTGAQRIFVWVGVVGTLLAVFGAGVWIWLRHKRRSIKRRK